MNWSDREMNMQDSSGEVDSTDHQELRAKPTKAIIGIGILVVLSLLMYEVNNFAGKPGDAQPQQNMAQRQTAPAPSTSSPN